MSSGQICLDVFGVTHTGNRCPSNEDYIQWQPLTTGGYIAVLADGMGGYAGGAIASQLAVESFIEFLQYEFDDEVSPLASEIPDYLYSAGLQANQVVREYRAANPSLRNMGTTLLALYFHGSEYWVLHVGDSRCYRVLDQEISPLTCDHSLAQSMVLRGVATGNQGLSPYRHVLTKALGPSDPVDFSLVHSAVQDQETLLLCSEGLYSSVPEQRILQVLKEYEHAEDIARSLLDWALVGPAEDNLSVIVVRPQVQYKPAK